MGGGTDLSQLHLLPAHAVVALLRDGKVTPKELIDIVEARVEATESEVHATHITCYERARKAAEALVHPAEPPAGYLWGLPVLIKDLPGGAVEGLRHTMGSKIWETKVAKRSDPVVLLLESRGCIVVGKTNVPELGAGSNTFNDIYPTTVSPWDTRTTAGGSSGGAAAALAACQCWLAHGSDLGGSLRTPAAFCGVVGFRTSVGLVPRVAPQALLEHVHPLDGPMARGVRDAALFLDAMSIRDDADIHLQSAGDLESFEAAAIDGAAGKDLPRRIGFSTLGCGIAPAVETISRDAARCLAGLAAGSLEELEAPFDLEVAERAFMLLRAKAFAQMTSLSERKPEKFAMLKPEIRWNIASGVASASALPRVTEELAGLQKEVAELFTHVDVLCTPATMDAAFDAAVRYPTALNGRRFSNYLDWMMPVCLVTPLLCPALVLPCGFLEDGRPVGLQLVAAPGRDSALLRAAAALEAALKLPNACPVPRCGSVPLNTVGPRTREEAALQHNETTVGDFLKRYVKPAVTISKI